MVYSAELYVHDLDKQAADALNQFPKFVKLLESYSANYDEKAAKIDLLSTAIRLGEKQMPEVYGLLPPICEQLGIDAPELYYVKDKHPNAATFGSTNPCIYVTSGLVNTHLRQGRRGRRGERGGDLPPHRPGRRPLCPGGGGDAPGAGHHGGAAGGRAADLRQGRRRGLTLPSHTGKR